MTESERIKLLIEALSRYQDSYPGESSTVNLFLDFLARSPNAFHRSNQEGHITGSAWIISPDFQCVLLLHHAKLDKWMQLGGHADGNTNVLEVAITEAHEESGSTAITALSAEIFDIDVHDIPARLQDPTHLHFDIRFLLHASSFEIEKNHESNALAWVNLKDVSRYSVEPTIQRMTAKCIQKLGVLHNEASSKQNSG